MPWWTGSSRSRPSSTADDRDGQVVEDYGNPSRARRGCARVVSPEREAATSQLSSEPDASVRVAVIDDHPAIVVSLAAAIEAADDLSLAGTAATLEGAVALLDSGSVDVVLCDIQLAGAAEGLRLLSMLGDRPSDGAGPRPALIILSGFEQPSLIRAAFERGAAGYLVKTTPIEDILATISTVVAGGTAFSAAAVRSVRTAPRRPSDREIQVIGLVSAGASNAEAASLLGLSEKTIESHLRRLFDRYGVLSRTELVVMAMREGWVSDAPRS